MDRNNKIPLILSIETDKVGTREIAFGMISILKPLISKICKVKVINIELLEGLFYSFYPTDQNNLPVYIDEEATEAIYSQININKLIGYRFLSDSPLARYVVEKEGIENVKYVEGIAIIPYNSEYLFEMHDEIENFEFTLQSYVKRGLFTYEFGPFDTDDFEIIIQICKQFNIKIVNRKDFSKWILLNDTDIDFYISPETWLRNSIPLVRMGQFPFFTLSLKAVRDKMFNNDYDRKFGDIYQKWIMKYVACMSFAEISDRFPFIREFIYSLRVNADYTISVQLPSYALVKEFEKKFNDNFERLHTVVICKDLEEAVIKKYIIQTVDNDAYPMIFSSAKQNNLGDGEHTFRDSPNREEILIHRSPLAKLYPSPFNFDENNMKEKGKELEEKMRNFYKTCHDGIEPVSLEEIDTLNLWDLLNLIPIRENNITYCFSKDTISKVQSNPLTRTPLSDEVKRNMNLGDYGLRGYFDVGILYGLYEKQNEEKEQNYESVGFIQVVRIPVEKEYRELYGNIFLVKVTFMNGYESDIFEISLPTIELNRIDELRSYVEELWKRGFFISDWAKALNEESFSVITTNPLLLRAKDSIFDGEKALQYLKLQLKT
jgi:hypothetical protein